jgi:hypothetical protein
MLPDTIAEHPSMRRRTPEAARKLGWSVSTLEKARVVGTGPPYFKIGRNVYYSDEDLDAFIAAGRRSSTSGTTPAPSPSSDNPPTQARRAFQDGYDAACEGPATCPFPPGSKGAWSWIAGFIEGQAAMMQPDEEAESKPKKRGNTKRKAA